TPGRPTSRPTPAPWGPRVPRLMAIDLRRPPGAASETATHQPGPTTAEAGAAPRRRRRLLSSIDHPARPWAWAAGLAALGLALTIGFPLLVAVCLGAIFLGAVFYLSPGDATTVLSLALAAMFVIPQRYVIAPLGAAGTPAILLGV